MVYHMNVFRVLGDVSHITSKCVLIWAIHSNRSAEGVSLITQCLYILVFITRYLDLFWTSPFRDFIHGWNFTIKLFYIATSAYIVFLMMRVYARTREREKAWRLGGYCFGGALIGAPVWYFAFRWVGSLDANLTRGFWDVLWVYSIILESVCVLPQLLLLRQTTVPTVIDSFYLATLGSYRGFYILNWIVRGATEGHFDPTSVVFGIIQTALYIDFAWVYWTRQRVKLRNGGVVDGDDLRQGWLVGRLIGRKSGEWDAINGDDDDDIEAAPPGRVNGVPPPYSATAPQPKQVRSWGRRGISVSADDGVHDIHRPSGADAQPLTDPQAFEDDDDEDDIPAPATSKTPETTTGDEAPVGGVGNGAEWRDDDGRK